AERSMRARRVSGCAGGWCLSFAPQYRRASLLHELGCGHLAHVPIAVATHRHETSLLLLVADDEHVGNLAKLAVADLPADRLGSLVHLGAQARRGQLGLRLARVIEVPVGDREDKGLDGCEPERELAPVVLDQDADETLE